ncbi:MAG: peptidoglycan-binding protein [Armatimonadota bacterium]|nr:peptidoglycan-binding protein [Armatimonadota bacterium]
MKPVCPINRRTALKLGIAAMGSLFLPGLGVVARGQGVSISDIEWPSLSTGDAGGDVYLVQYLLRARGYDIVVDGNYAAQTARRVRQFQAASGLPVTGEVGGSTWRALIIPVQYGSRGDAVRAAQFKLKHLGFQTIVDGRFSDGTRRTVRRFQVNQGITADGVCGRQTWEYLIKAQPND